jgi:hypothetical protein
MFLATFILSVSELALAVLLVAFAFGHTDSPGLTRAWFEYSEHPSPQTESAFKQKKTAMERIDFVSAVGAGLLLAVNSYVLVKTIRKIRAGSQPEPKPTSKGA